MRMFLYCGRLIISVAHHFLLTICNLPPPFLQPSTFRLLLFAKFNTKIFSFPMVLCKKVYFCTII
nr:MAG TPA: hypothetical protein [Caudoviricetes sp.]